MDNSRIETLPGRAFTPWLLVSSKYLIYCTFELTKSRLCQVECTVYSSEGCELKVGLGLPLKASQARWELEVEVRTI